MDTIIGARPEVRSIGRIITVGQDGLLDQCSHLDAKRMHDALAWALRLVDTSVSGGATPLAGKHLEQLYGLLDCLDEITEQFDHSNEHKSHE